MAWQYEQSTGRYYDASGTLRGTGYSGHDTGKNNPDAEREHGIGPTPRGRYRLGPPRESKNTGHYIMDLIPEPGTDTFGRGSMEMHGDSIEHPGMASHGCIIQRRDVREATWQSGDHIIEVVR